MRFTLNKKTIGLFLGPLVFLLIMFGFQPENMSEAAHAVLASTAWIAIWWITEALPMAVTALLPIVLFPLTGGSDIKAAVSGYSHPFIFLFIGGFILAIALEKWWLHKRIALVIINWVGTSKRMIILGFMLATAFLSMWISNTATAVMMLPIGMAIIEKLRSDTEGKEENRFGTVLMLGIAYSASIGGIATLIGTPPNLILVGIIQETYNVDLSFFDWFKLALPFAMVMLFICWFYLTRFSFDIGTPSIPGGREEIRKQLKGLGKMSFEEKSVAVVFTLTALAWISRSYLLEPILPAIDDTIIAIASAVLLFLLPASQKGENLLQWDDAKKIPWGILLLFGGGISLAVAFDKSGLAEWIGNQFTLFEGMYLLIIILCLVAAVNFLTEITSNTATTAVILPLLAPLAVAVDTHPFLLMSAAAIAASCAFMLPVATPPNALVFGSGQIKMEEMMRAGFLLNLISILLISLLIYFVMPLVWDLPVLY